jgi:hypothetical protein
MNDKPVNEFEMALDALVKEVESKAMAWVVEDVPDDWCERVAIGIVWAAFEREEDVLVGDDDIKAVLKAEGWLEEVSHGT